MKLTVMQTLRLNEAIHDDFNLEMLDWLLLTKLGKRREDITLGQGIGFKTLVMEVIKAADHGHWVGDLIKHALEGREEGDPLISFVRQNPEWDPNRPIVNGTDWYKTNYLRENRVILRRECLRDNMRSIGKPQRSRVMVVNGPRGSGKTYSVDFITYIIENHPDERGLRQQIIYLDLDEYSVSPGALAAQIGQGMSWPAAPETAGEQATRWVTPLRNWLVNGFNRVDGAQPPPPPIDVWWIVFDGFRLQTHPPETFDLIAKLVEAAEKELKNVKIVLLNYGDRLPPQLDGFVLREDIPPIVRDDVVAFIDRVYAESGTLYDATNVHETVDSVLEQVNAQMKNRSAPSEDWLIYLNIALNAATKRLPH